MNFRQIILAIWTTESRCPERATSGHRRYTPDSATPKWSAIRDDQGWIIVDICHNSDVGNAWEWADSAGYREHAASVAYRIGVNYIIYAMTH